ncbi:MAG: amidohydrolase family protein [Bacillota bacterium]|jgi:cytosine/adenosine deaminase-related metal-dependent hydrolase
MKKTVDLLILGGLVGTMDPAYTTIPDGAIALDHGIIVEIGSRRELEDRYEAQTVVEASGRVVFPGLVISHTHMPSVVGHNMPVDFSKFHDFMDLLTKWWWPDIEDQTTPEDIYWTTLFASMKMLKAGTTCVGEMVEAPMALPGCLDASARALEEIGLRAVVAFEATERISQENGRLGIEENLRFVKERNTPASRIRGRFGLHTVDTCSPQMIQVVRQLAGENGAGIFIHVSEIPPSLTVATRGTTAVRLLDQLGCLGPDVLAVHCIHLDEEEMDLLAASDVKVAHTPMSNMLGGNGVSPIPDMLDRGITVSIGHDCFFTLDTFEYLRAAYLIHKVHRQNPGLVPPNQALEMVTSKGARALGLDAEVGSLEVGKRADLIVVKPQGPTPVIPATLMPFMVSDVNGRDVETVVVDGRVVVDQGRVVTVDEEKVTRRCIERSSALWRRAGAID